MVSVIVPIYNLEGYLKRCIESILCQSYKELQIILVDDGSTDGSGKICDDYAKEDNRIEVIHKNNAGVSSARNKGMEVANGEYIAFIDGDDYIDNRYFEVLVTNAEKYKCDISCCQLLTIETNGTKEKLFNITSKMFDAKYIIDNYFYNKFIKAIMYGPYNKLYRKEAIGKVRFKDYKYAEDILFVFEVLLNTNNIYYDEYIGYYYIHREDSAVKSHFTMNRFDYVDAAREIERECELNKIGILKDIHQWVYHHSLVTVRQALMNSIYTVDKQRLEYEKKYLRENKEYLRYETAMRKIDYYIIQYAGFLFIPMRKMINFIKLRLFKENYRWKT